MIYLDNKQFKIQRYEEIVYVSNQKILINLIKQQMVIRGKNLEIFYYTPLEIHGKGKINQITLGELK